MELNMPYHKNPAVKKAWWDLQDGYFKWEIDRGAKKKVLRREFVEALVRLTHGVSTYNLLDALPAFVQEYGPLWSGNRIEGTRALSHLWTFACIAPIVEGLRQPGVPPDWSQAYADSFVFSPLEEWLRRWNPEERIPILPPEYLKDPRQGLALAQARYAVENFIPTALGVERPPRRKYALWRPPLPSSFKAPFVAVEDTPAFWPRFRLPKKPLDTWEKKKDWFIHELGRNVCELLRKGMEFYVDITREPEGSMGYGGMGHAVIRARCKDAFTFAMAHLVFEWRYRVCPACGKPAIGSTCGSSRCKKDSLKTAGKQRVLDYLYHQQRGGKITGEQYDLCKQIADRWKHLDDVSRLMAKVAASMQKKWPERDFSFILKGFGSRSRKASAGVERNSHPRQE